MHEYAPLENEGDWKWRLLIQPFATAACRKILPSAEAVSTVGRAIRDRFETESGRSVELIRNTANFHPRSVAPNHSIDAENLFRLVHVGVAIRARHLENMFEAVRDLRGVSLDLLLLPTDPDYYRELLQLSEEIPNVHLRQPVRNDDVVAILSEYHCGVVTIPPTNFNYANGLPNKFFQYVQARIPVVTGPIPEIKAIVEELGIGWVSESFCPSSIRRTILIACEHNRIAIAERLDSAALALSQSYDNVTRKRIAQQLLGQFH